MKLRIAGLLAAALTTLVLADTTIAGDPSPTLSRILKRGEMTVAMSGSQPPLNATDKSGKLIGLEVELAKILAASMGVKVKFVKKPFAQLLPSLEKGEVDMVMSGVTITPERNARVAFAGPYFISGKSLLTKSDKLADAEDAAEVNSPEVRLAALAGSTSAQFVGDAIPKAKLTTIETYDEGVRMLKEDKIDALVADFPYCVVAALRNEKSGLDTLAEPFTYEPIGIALPAGDPLLVNAVENFLETMRGSGALLELKAAWFLDESWMKQLP
jgi:polar amino acid transport system substrate-binding protein